MHKHKLVYHIYTIGITEHKEGKGRHVAMPSIILLVAKLSSLAWRGTHALKNTENHIPFNSYKPAIAALISLTLYITFFAIADLLCNFMYRLIYKYTVRN